jgi:hypothetical protein
MKKKKKDAASPAPAEAGAETLRQRRRRRRRPSRANAPHKHNTIKAAARALGAYPRWLGAFRELVTRSNRFKAAAAAVKRFTDAAAAESSGGGGGGGGNVLAELQQRLDDARWAAATRHRMSRIVARLFDAGVVPGRADMTPSAAADPAAQLPPAEELRGLMSALNNIAREVGQRLRHDAVGRSVRSLEELGVDVLAADAAQRQPPALPQPVLAQRGRDAVAAMGGHVPWALAAEALAAEATGAAWLLAGESREEVSSTLLLFFSYFYCRFVVLFLLLSLELCCLHPILLCVGRAR